MEILVRKQNVLWFDIAVDNPSFMLSMSAKTKLVEIFKTYKILDSLK
jgi:hypothetical protein